MGSLFNEDFLDFIKALEAEAVEYLLIGGYAVILHGYNRTTGDMDVFVNQTADNHRRLTAAFRRFGMPLFDMTMDRFLDHEAYDVFTFGVEPRQIDIITVVKGIEFETVYPNRIRQYTEDLTFNLIAFDDLLIAKRAAARYRDLDDLENLRPGSLGI